MSKLSFKTFCIEQYADYSNKTSDEIYNIFKEKNILKVLDYDYEDLHGMSREWLFDFFDKYLEEKQ